jgi:hypothetical protein
VSEVSQLRATLLICTYTPLTAAELLTACDFIYRPGM